jgi:hypothetical protein
MKRNFTLINNLISITRLKNKLPYIYIAFLTNSFVKTLSVLLIAFVLTLSSNSLKAQPCSPLNISNSSVTAADCPSGGSISIIATGTGLTYQLISGPSGYSTASNTTGLFNSLNAGTYIAEVRDACAVTATVTKVVTNNYPTFSVSNAATSNVCASGISGGTITATVTGGRAPYQYDIVSVGNIPVYGSATGSSSYNETVSTFGNYRVYVKDACAEVRTYDIALQPVQPTPAFLWWEDLSLDRPCGEIMDGLPTITWNLHLLDINGFYIGFNNLVGSTYQIYKPNIANSITYSEDNCTTALGALLTSGTITAAGIPAGDNLTFPVVMPQEDVILIFTTTCGQTFKYCHNFNQGNPITPDAEYRFIHQSCAASWSNQSINVFSKYVTNMAPPYTFLLTKSNSATITNTDGYFYNLKPNNFPLSVKVTDACGITVTKTLTMPVQGSGLQFSVGPEWGLTCTTAKNTATAEIIVSGGDLPGIADATNVVITGGTVTAVPLISAYNDWVPGYIASNLLAGYAYKVVITNLCGEKDSVQFTVPNDQWGQNVLDWNLTATANALCGQNKSIITANSGYTGYRTANYYLYNLTSPNTIVASNTTGVFENVLSGNYKVKFIVPGINTPCPNLEVKDSVNITVIGDGTAQTIIRKTITTCEINGTPTASGKAIIEVNGSAPFTYEIIKTSLVGTGATEVWTVSSTNNSSNIYTWDIPLAGDPSNTIYTLRTTDKCGNKVTTQASLQPLNAPTLQAQNNPCIGTADYTLTVNPYGGNFTYSWVKLPDVNTILSNQNTITFPGAYNAANDGTYRCYISLTGCVDRTKDIQISSTNCNAPLPVKLISFNGSLSSNTAQLKWISENEINFNYYEVEKSQNGKDFIKINTVFANNANILIKEYGVADNLNNYNGTVVFYRLKIVDTDGKYVYSSIIRLSINGSKKGILVYPNPTKTDVSVTFVGTSNAQANIRVIDKVGRTVLNEKMQVVKGNNSFTIIQVNKLPPGSYIVEVITVDGVEIAKFVKL